MKQLSLIIILFGLFSCQTKKENSNPLIFEDEVNFKTLRQVTFGGDNAEAYWSFDDKQLIFQSNNKNWNVECDQMFLMNADQTFKNNDPKMVSTGLGRTTCSYFLPDNEHILYASTHEDNEKVSRGSFKKRR